MPQGLTGRSLPTYTPVLPSRVTKVEVLVDFRQALRQVDMSGDIESMFDKPMKNETPDEPM